MTIANPGSLFTPDDLLRMEDAVNYELVDGKLVERHMGMESSEIAARIVLLIGMFLRTQSVGRLFGADASYQCFSNAPKKVRKPDVSFIRSERVPGNRLPTGHCPIPPDLVVEVISPGDLAYEVEEKVAEYLDAGVPLVWIVNPPTRTVRIRRPKSSAHGSVAELSGDDVIDGEDVLPGFSCKVSEFFA
jgi:Uma2 family endonuclease